MLPDTPATQAFLEYITAIIEEQQRAQAQEAPKNDAAEAHQTSAAA